MDQSDLILLLAFLPEVIQQRLTIHAAVTCAINPAIQRGNGLAFQSAGENMDIFRPMLCHPRTVRGAKIVIARGNKHRQRAASKGIAHCVQTVRGVSTVKNITCDQDQVTAFPQGELYNLFGYFQQFTAQKIPLFSGKSGKRCIQMPVSGVQNFHHFHPLFLLSGICRWRCRW